MRFAHVAAPRVHGASKRAGWPRADGSGITPSVRAGSQAGHQLIQGLRGRVSGVYKENTQDKKRNGVYWGANRDAQG